MMEHINITIPIELKERVDKEALRENSKRSTLIQKAVRFYLHAKEKQSKGMLLREGYLAMAEESEKMLKEFNHIDRETWKYAD